MEINKIKINKEPFEKVELREATVGDAIRAERISEVQMGRKYDAALISEVGLFDGKKLTMEELLELPDKFFFQLQDAMADGQLSILHKELFTLQLQQISGMGR